MKWEDLNQSKNVVDRRGQRSSAGGVAGIGIGGLVLAVIVGLITGQNPLSLLSMFSSPAPATTQSAPINDEDSQFVRAVLGDLELVWGEVFKNSGQRYTPPQLILFSGSTTSACGAASAASGPFYCPADQDVYIDLNFFRSLRETASKDADFARAYVIAHEVGHHIQKELGISDQVQAEQRRMNQRDSNALLVRLKLQADCFAGVWAYYTNERGLLERGDLNEAINAAHAVGDDTLQKQSRGYVVPDSFTHGSSQQRIDWFKQGLSTGDPNSCDTFNARNL